MIGRLAGVLLEKRPPFLLIDVNGVGYEVEAPLSTFFSLPQTGEPVVLHTHLAVREDAHLLYGFASETERRLFRELIKVSGVGAKVALAILSGMNANEFAACVQAEDVKTLTRLPGIGKKTAERLIVEMRDRLDKALAEGGVRLPSAAPVTVAPASASDEAQAALISLGYKPAEAAKLINAVGDKAETTEELIRLALRGAVS
jgi:Holliday junction DNA helicase RuvA